MLNERNGNEERRHWGTGQAAKTLSSCSRSGCIRTYLQLWGVSLEEREEERLERGRLLTNRDRIVSCVSVLGAVKGGHWGGRKRRLGNGGRGGGKNVTGILLS